MSLSESRIEKIREQSEVTKVKLSTLKVDRSYQRDTSEALVDEIAANWNAVASELLLVSNRGTRKNDADVEGGMFIVNGQHRTKAGLKRGEETMDARVIDLSKEKDPAAIEAQFRLQTNVRLSDKPLERFRAQLRAGNEESLAIAAILAEFDTEVNLSPSQEIGVNSVAGVEQLYRIDDGSLLRDTLQVIKDTFSFVGGKNVSASMLKGIAWFIDKHASESDRGRLVDKLQFAGLAALDRRARAIAATMGGSLWLNYYRAIVDFYNERLGERQRLEWKTRGAGRLSKGGRYTAIG